MGQIRQETLDRNYGGSYENYVEAMKAKGRKGGQAKVPKGAAIWSEERRRLEGSKGGKKRVENEARNSQA